MAFMGFYEGFDSWVLGVSLAGFLGGAFFWSGRISEGSPGPPGPAKPQKRNPTKKPARLPSGTQKILRGFY